MPKGMETKLYPQRWVQLGYLAVLALLSDWVCFSVAAAPETWVQTYAHDPATLIDIFLFTNVFFCFVEPAIVRRIGLRNCIVGAAVVMTSGCALRSGIPLTGAVPSYPFVVAGTVLVGAAQPFFQCTPPLLSATWFGAEERATATATAINFNQVGIATAFLVGGAMAGSAEGLASYFDLITACSVLVTIGAFFQFQEKPELPPSSSAAAKILEDSQADPNARVPSFFETARQLLAVPGFTRALCAFVVSIGVSNVLSAFIEEILLGVGISGQQTIDLAGAGFQVAFVPG
jgi:MFS family permease